MSESTLPGWMQAHLTSMQMVGLNALCYTIQLQAKAAQIRAEDEYLSAAQRREFESLVAIHHSRKHPAKGGFSIYN